jgi:SAM-dependent methyltransferase
MSTLGEWIAYTVIRIALPTPFGAKGNPCREATPKTEPYQGVASATFLNARAEAGRFQDFTQFLGERLDIRGLRVLDFGCGYGGKSVEFVRQGGAREVVGVEPFEHVIDLCRSYAESVSEPRCSFEVCGATTIPASDAEFDAVVSHDVLEHVAHPPSTISEISRVLKPGGMAYIIFTPYWGALSHHLGFVTRVPGIHWIFSARSLVRATNRVLSGQGGGRFNTRTQPPPRLSYHHRFECLPTLNGLGSEDFLALARQNSLEVVFVEQPPIAARIASEGSFAARLNKALMSVHPLAKELLSFNLVCVLRKSRE